MPNHLTAREGGQSRLERQISELADGAWAGGSDAHDPELHGPWSERREAAFRAGDPHCCPSAFRESTLRWNGTSWEEVSSEVVPNDPAGR